MNIVFLVSQRNHERWADGRTESSMMIGGKQFLFSFLELGNRILCVAGNGFITNFYESGIVKLVVVEESGESGSGGAGAGGRPQMWQLVLA